MPRLSIVLALVVLAGCHNDPAKPASDAQIVETATDGGAPRKELVLEGKRVLLPDLDADPSKRDTRSEPGNKRAAYRTQTGAWRLVYRVGDALFLGGIFLSPQAGAPSEPDFTKAPDEAHALGTMFEVSPARRAELVAAVRASEGDDGMVRFLLSAAGVDDTMWEAEAAKLPPAQLATLKEGMGAALAEGQPQVAVGRAAKLANLADPKLAPQVAARARDARLAPQLAAVFLRAMPPADASKAGCEVLGRPLPKPSDSPALVDAAFVAVRDGSCPAAEAVAEAWLATTRCQPSLRCDAGGTPLTPASVSTQAEPLCTLAQIKEAKPEAGRGPLFAYGLLLAKDKVPEAFTTAHARRRYAIEQKGERRCDDTAERTVDVPTLSEGTPCVCDEPGLRYQACRTEHEGMAQTGICRFVVDDKAKKLTKITAAPNGVIQ